VAGPVDAPLARPWVVEPQRHAGEARPVIGDEGVDVAEAAGEQTGLLGCLERLPFRAALQALLQSLVADAPVAGLEVEVVGSVAFGHGALLRRGEVSGGAGGGDGARRAGPMGG